MLSALQGAHELLLPVAQQDVVVGPLSDEGLKSLLRPQAQVGVVVLADQAGQGLLPRQVLQVPGPRAGAHPGRNAGAGYERRDWLPVNELGCATRHPAHLTEEQVAQRVRQQVEASLDPGGPILQLSDETYPEGHWVVSTQSTRYRNSRTEETAPAHEGLRSELRAPSRTSRSACPGSWPSCCS